MGCQYAYGQNTCMGRNSTSAWHYKLTIADFIYIAMSIANVMNYLPYSGLFSRGEFFTNWPYLTFSWEKFHESTKTLSAY